MKADEKEVLGRTFTAVLEEVAFLFAEYASSAELEDPPPPCLQAKMRFTGKLRGVVTIVAAQRTCLDIVSNMLGIDPSEDEAAQRRNDAFGELLNVTCGRFLTDLAGTDPIFDLTVPEVNVLELKSWSSVAGEAGSLIFLVDETPVIVGMSMEGSL